jgi:pyridoxal 5'-phosphate synthase / NAD(P)H-hydrate epimerase
MVVASVSGRIIGLIPSATRCLRSAIVPSTATYNPANLRRTYHFTRIAPLSITPIAAKMQASNLAAAPSAPSIAAAVSFLGQRDAQALDEDLMGPLGFSVDQLMELAGLSVASALASEYPSSTHKRVLVFAGPGNNGGDGLVAARHLHHFGYDVSVCYPKRIDKSLFHGLVTQCASLGIPFVEVDRVLTSPLADAADVVLDALFGFSFKGEPRPPFKELIAAMTVENAPIVVAVDVPSGWDVEQGDVSGTGLHPDMLVSLTAPKECARKFKGKHHYLGGRFVPPEIVSKYGLQLPAYPGTSQCVRIGGASSSSVADVAGMRLSYGARGAPLDETAVDPDPMTQFAVWFEDASRCPDLREPNAMALATVDPSGVPSLRMVLLKGFGPQGLTWYTNYNSRKGQELEENDRAAITFWWEALERQVRFEGRVERVPAAESDAYWASRPWGHRIGAIASRQSSVVLGGRAELEARLTEAEGIYPEDAGPVPRPDTWGGFRLVPYIVEFWAGRSSRLHDRLRYLKQDHGRWILERLSP